jgi:hypothetical protein
MMNGKFPLLCAMRCNQSESRNLANILPRMARMARISLEQKGTKATKEEYFFVAFVCFCGNRFPMGALVENSESVKSGKSVVPFLWLRLAALGCLAANPQTAIRNSS